MQFGRRPQTQQDDALRGQDHEVQILPEGHRNGVHQKEDGGSVQHASPADCGGAGTPRSAGRQHPPPTH